jgi:predicted membrane protein
MWVGIFVISCIISSFIAAIFSKLMEFLFFERIFKIRKEDDIKEFESIKKLLLLNWQFYKKDPSVASIEHIAKDSPYYKDKR